MANYHLTSMFSAIGNLIKMNNEKSNVTLASLANVNELVRHITQEIMGNDISTSIGDTPLTRSLIYSLVQSRVRENFARYNGVL